MVIPCPKADPECEDNLSPEAQAIIEHIGRILAEEYIQLMKVPEGTPEQAKEEK